MIVIFDRLKCVIIKLLLLFGIFYSMITLYSFITFTVMRNGISALKNNVHLPKINPIVFIFMSCSLKYNITIIRDTIS